MMKQRNFNVRYSIRLTKELEREVEKLYRNNQDVFQSCNHVVRCAIIRLIKDFKEKKVQIVTN